MKNLINAAAFIRGNTVYSKINIKVNDSVQKSNKEKSLKGEKKIEFNLV